ncbi:MAG: hypothetical protein KDA61_15080 [Planctomycetales bacterium]|nr:hypothetical protein [Planctomycetales bacterium]
MKRSVLSRFGVVCGAALLVAAPASTDAAVLFSDSFNRPDSRDIDGDATGVVNNTSTSFAASAIYSQPQLDPNNADPTNDVQDADATNGGGALIAGEQLNLAVGAGTSNAFVNHNFVDASILADGGFTVSLDVAGYAQGTNGQGAGFAVGMSQAEAASTRDVFSGPARMNGGSGSVIGNNVAAEVVSDFWVFLRGNSSLAWGSNDGSAISGSVGLPAKTGVIQAAFRFTDFNSGSNVEYSVFYDGMLQGTGSFVWSGDNENYIGIDARDSQAVMVDNFVVASLPEPTAAVLGLIGLVAAARRRREG